jgi:uncharacterized Tic20 family protein
VNDTYDSHSRAGASPGESAFSFPTEDERQWGMFAHLSILSTYVTGIGLVAGPLIVWLMKKDESAFVDACGREALNFGISVLLWNVAAVLCLFTIVLIPVSIALWCVLGVAGIVLPIVAGLKAKEGVAYRYPLVFRFF